MEARMDAEYIWEHCSREITAEKWPCQEISVHKQICQEIWKKEKILPD
jgi:hypothetical protein